MKLADLHRVIANHAGEIADLFKSGAKVSIVVRNPSLADGDVFISDDSIDEVQRALDRLAVKQEHRLEAFEG
jgi:hypothetical protein